jgi:PAS domain S-box-containing protein
MDSFRFTLSLVAVFVSIFAVASLVSYNSYKNAVRNTIRSDETRAELMGKIVLEHHRAALGIVQSYASRPLLVDSVRKKDFEGALTHLTNLSKENPEILSSWISNPDSTAWVNFPVDKRGFNKDLSYREWYKGVSKEWKPYVSDIYKLFTQNEDLAVSLCVPIFDDKKMVIGIFGASLTTAFYNDLVKHISFDMDASITLIDREGHVIYGDKYPYEKKIIAYPLFGTVKGARGIAHGTIEVRDTSDRNRITYLSFARVEEIGWSVVVEKPRSNVVRSNLGEFIQIAVISFLAFLVAVFFMAHLRSKRRQVEALEEQSRLLREQALLLDLSHEAILVRDQDNRIIFWNSGAEETYGWTKEEALGNISHSFLKTVWPVPFDEHVVALTREGRWEGELIHTRKDGSQLTVLSRQVLKQAAADTPAGILEINIDITKRKQAEDETRKYAAQLESSNRELQDFAFVASHDLQEPLRKIQAFGDQLKTDCKASLGAEGADYLDRMRSAAARMQDLIQALLNYSRVTTKASPFSPTDLAAAARAAMDNLEMSLRETGGEVEIGELTTIDADQVQMVQLFQNLIGNALKFHGEEKPVVKIYGQAEKQPKGTHDEKYTIFVEDNGIGFDEKYLDRIFTPFQRLHGRGTYDGTGIGLAICRKIVDRHGGSITAKSIPGKGTTFAVSLPVKQSKGERE